MRRAMCARRTRSSRPCSAAPSATAASTTTSWGSSLAVRNRRGRSRSSGIARSAGASRATSRRTCSSRSTAPTTSWTSGTLSCPRPRSPNLARMGASRLPTSSPRRSTARWAPSHASNPLFKSLACIFLLKSCE